jgi:hypothetical protein
VVFKGIEEFRIVVGMGALWRGDDLLGIGEDCVTGAPE